MLVLVALDVTSLKNDPVNVVFECSVVHSEVPFISIFARSLHMTLESGVEPRWFWFQHRDLRNVLLVDIGFTMVHYLL